MTTITILGLGEAGRLYARGLRDAGAEVSGYDPFVDASGHGIRQLSDLADALRGADVVLSLVGSRVAADVADAATGHMPSGAIYADLNTASPETKLEISRTMASRGVAMVDVAVLAPVPRAAQRTPLLVSGSAGRTFADLLSPFGVPIEVVSDRVGEAARLKLLRSVFMKGLATLVIEGLGAARASGSEEWLRGQMASELGPDGGALVDRLVAGTYDHAERREHEVRDALEVLEAAGQSADMTRATLVWFERILAERD